MPELGETRIVGRCNLCGEMLIERYQEIKEEEDRIIKQWTRMKHFDTMRGPCIQNLHRRLEAIELDEHEDDDRVLALQEEMRAAQEAIRFLEREIKKLALQSQPIKPLAIGAGVH